jgi:Zierdtviridae exonuclease
LMDNLPLLRTSERISFKRCQQRWYWAWRMGLRGKGKPADALWFGTGVHIALAEWYCGPGKKRGPHPAETFALWAGEEINNIKAARPDEFGFEEEIWVEAHQLGTAMLDGYVKKYGKDPKWDVIAPEQTFQIDIPRRSGNGLLATYAGTFDLVYRDLEDGLIKLGEHKTAKAISTAHLSLDDQAGGYWAVASHVLRDQGVLGPKEHIAEITYNFLRKALPDDRDEDAEGRKLNKDGTISKRQPSAYFHREPIERLPRERKQQIVKIQNEAAWMETARRYPDRLMKTPTTTCHWDCAFFDMCELHDRGGDDYAEYMQAVYHQADPYADHRKSAAE